MADTAGQEGMSQERAPGEQLSQERALQQAGQARTPQGGVPQQRTARDDGWSDIHLDDIIKGVGALIGIVAGAVGSVGSALSGPSYTRPLNTGAPARLGAGVLLAGVRDPVVELFDEGSEIVLIVEWPYVEAQQIEVEARDDILSLAIGGEFPYHTDILLPACVDGALRQSYRNGILEVRLTRL